MRGFWERLDESFPACAPSPLPQVHISSHAPIPLFCFWPRSAHKSWTRLRRVAFYSVFPGGFPHCGGCGMGGVGWWWLFPRLRRFRENVRSFIPRLRFFFLEVEISSRTLMSLLMPGSVHSGSVRRDDCGRMFPHAIHVLVIIYLSNTSSPLKCSPPLLLILLLAHYYHHQVYR